MAYAERNGNRVKLLLDGEEIFASLKSGFDRVAAAPRGTAQTYVRMAFWLIVHDIGVGDRNAFPRDVNRLVRQIGLVLRAGHDVELILWYPNAKTRPQMSEQPREHDALAAAVGALDLSLHRSTAGASGRARVYRERYEGWTGSSQHQKIAIFSVAGQRTAVMGGLNLALRYFDTVDHPLNWHDTAVELAGPVTGDIEDEWMRRWRRVIEIADAAVPTERVCNHLTARGITDEWTKPHAADIALNYTPQNAPAAAAGATLNVPVRLALTRSTKTTRTTEIRDRMLELIGNANQRIYFENCQFTDPDLVRAIYQRKQTVPGLQVVVVTNALDGGQGYITRRAWLHLALRDASCRGVYYKSQNDPNHYKRVDRGAGAAPAWEVEDNYTPSWATWHQWLETDAIQIAKTSAGRHLIDTKRKLFHELLELDVDFHFFTPVRHTGWRAVGGGRHLPTFGGPCVHSKVAVIDDYLICGSANWTYRSMQYDGEMAGFMRHNGLANHALTRLLDHFDRGHVGLTLANLGATARASADLILAAGAGAFPFGNELILLPLEYRRYETGLVLFWGDESPAHSWLNRVLHPKDRFAGLKRDLPNWTWW